LRETLAAKGGAAVIFACATSQVQFLEALVEAEEIDWSRVTMFHMDEYLGITSGHPASFRRFLREQVVEPANRKLVPPAVPKAVHYLEGDALEPIEECERYSRLLSAQPIDLCCLGIGENGHLAFNDPPVAHFTGPRQVNIVKLEEASRRQQVGEGFFPDLAAVPQYAFTLTIPMLCAAKRMLCIVPDQRKARAVSDSLQGPDQTACPASFLRTQPQATLYLDAASASLL
ncbi:MAG: glucosamine-6-phosphate deaminase, partial [Candidatus Omnitrophica bacterium]|nr:glucosamine-6-phosphate deaminase [Candidatus Omnitrophota bacterium]